MKRLEGQPSVPNHSIRAELHPIADVEIDPAREPRELGPVDVAGDHGVDAALGEDSRRRLAQSCRVFLDELGLVAPAARGRGHIGDPVGDRARQEPKAQDREWMVEDAAHDAVGAPRAAQRVAVGKEESEAMMLGDVGIGDELDPELALEPARLPIGARPIVVIPAHEQAPHAAIGCATERTQHREVAGGRRPAVLEPEVEEIAQDVEDLGRSPSFEELDQRSFLRLLLGRGLAAEVGVGEEIDGDRHAAAT